MGDNKGIWAITFRQRRIISNMTSFGWKRKSGTSVSKAASAAFLKEARGEEDELVDSDEIDWLTLAPNKRQCTASLEDAVGKSHRLKKEGTVLADADRYWEAIRKWDEALNYTPSDEKLYEMKAQALLSLNELYPAINMVEKVIVINPNWWIGHQTLGRVLLGLGEVRKAIKSFSRAIHLYPAEDELWREDLQWAVNLLDQKKDIANKLKASADNCNSNKIVELEEKVPCSSLDENSQKYNCGKSESKMDSLRIQSIDISQTTQAKVQTLSQLPTNYVKMRDENS